MSPEKLAWAVLLGVSRGLYVFAGSFVAAVVYRYVSEERIVTTTALFIGLLTAGFASGPQRLTELAFTQTNVEVLAWAIASLFAIPGRAYGDAVGRRLLEARLASVKPTTKTYRLPVPPPQGPGQHRGRPGRAAGSAGGQGADRGPGVRVPAGHLEEGRGAGDSTGP